MTPDAYLFNGSLFRPDGLTAEQKKAATPLYAGSPPPDAFEEWFKREYPLYKDDRDSTLKHALRRCWRACLVQALG